MDKINLLSINFRGELVKAVDLGFLRVPVVAVLPILREFPDLFDVGAVLPSRARKLIGPFGFRQTVPKIDKNLVGNMHFEWPDGCCRGLWISLLIQCLRMPRNDRREQKYSRANHRVWEPPRFPLSSAEPIAPRNDFVILQ